MEDNVRGGSEIEDVTLREFLALDCTHGADDNGRSDPLAMEDELVKRRGKSKKKRGRERSQACTKGLEPNKKTSTLSLPMDWPIRP